MSKNVVFEVSQTIPSQLSKENILQQLNIALREMPKIYSYLVYANYKDSALVSWTIKYSVNETSQYNTLTNTDVISDIYDILLHDKKTTKRIIGYKQPSFEILLELYTPLIRTLAKRACSEWTELEYEDAVSICQLTMLKLYRKGYYLHKYLLEKSFKNEIRMSLRKTRYAPEMLSLDEIMYDSGDDTQITLIDMLEDTSLTIEQEERDRLEQVHSAFMKMKDFIVDMIGERRFDQLYREYSNKTVSHSSAMTMQRIKNELKKLGIDKSTLEAFNVT